ncbi:MAG: 2Fe-2S iron-sulfur cluster-binding protein [Mucilaginibacter sp.]|uniref:2Fe-2S iron-sulfur cluster-binding protein n=1 Tax=Mucilaginibacter sp. TaxID=1882438 RepID=UPI0031B14D4D
MHNNPVTYAIYITVIAPNGIRELLNITALIGMTLMDVLIKRGYRAPGICGGTGLCKACQVTVIAGVEKLNEPSEKELIMLKVLGEVQENSRMACQMRVRPGMNGLIIKLESKKIYKL